MTSKRNKSCDVIPEGVMIPCPEHGPQVNF